MVSWIVGFYTLGTMFSTTAIANLGPNPTPGQVNGILGPMFQGMALMIPVTLALELVAMVLLLIGFRKLKRVDSARFSTPSIMMIILIVGSLIAGFGVVPFFYGIPAILTQVPTTPGSVPSSSFMSALAGVVVYALVAGIGGLLALIGLIGGVILGLWRVGSRYDEPLFKIGAIFIIIPLLDVVAPILILVAARQARGRLPKAM